jgi:hypothetical protein
VGTLHRRASIVGANLLIVALNAPRHGLMRIDPTRPISACGIHRRRVDHSSHTARHERPAMRH